MTRLNVIFFGSAELARASLAALAENPAFRVLAVVTQPDRPKGRDLKLQPPPVKQEAVFRQLLVFQPERARRPEFVSELAQLNPDLIVVAAYGQILPVSILELPRFGCLNVHTSLLPKYRGAAPIQWAILDDQPETGVTIMEMDAGLDTGDILTQERTRIEPTDNAETLHDRLACIGAQLLVQTIPDYVEGRVVPRKQPDEGVSYARKITKDDGRLDWQQPARVLWNRIRAFTPWPGAFAFLPDVQHQPMIKVWRAELTPGQSGQPGEILQAGKTGLTVACGQDALRILELQREGGRRMAVAQFLAGCLLHPGQRLLSTPPSGEAPLAQEPGVR